MGSYYSSRRRQKVLEMDRGDGDKTLRKYLTPSKYTLKMVKMVNFVFCIFATIKKKKFFRERVAL